MDSNVIANKTQEKTLTDLESCMNQCWEKFNDILTEVLANPHQEAHRVEAHIFRQLLQLGLLLLKVFFANHEEGNYGPTLPTAKGIARRGRRSQRSYYSIFGKLKMKRYLYQLGQESLAPLDIRLNLPQRCYSYFLAEGVNLININGAYEQTVELLKKFFDLSLSVSAVETISKDSAPFYEAYYEHKQQQAKPAKPEELTVVSFDGKGVPMIKKEAEKIKGRLGKGEKRQKKKEALVGVSYHIPAHRRNPEEVAGNLVFPEKKDRTSPSAPKAQSIRYIASVEQPKKSVMEQIKEEVQGESFDQKPLVCVMDGAKSLWKLFERVFKTIKNQVLILDIIHVLEYLWLIAHVKYKEGSTEAAQYVYEKLLVILRGKVASYIIELQNEMLTGSWKNSQKKTFGKVITYFKNHRPFMRYDQYLARGYPISSGVVESACSHVVKNRMEIPGARWSLNGAEYILKLRSVVKSQHWEDYWEFYTGQSQRNEVFPQPVDSANLRQKISA
jgi:hypothetical protein